MILKHFGKQLYIMYNRVEWTNKKLEHWNPVAIKSFLMVGTQ